QRVFFVPVQPTAPRSFRKVVEEALAAEPDGSRGLILALQDGLHPAEMNRDQIQRGPITQRTIAASAQTHSDLVRRAEQGDDDDPKRMELPQDLPPERPGEHGPWVFEPRDPARSDQPGNEPPALVEKFIRDLDALRPDPFSIKKPGQDFLGIREVLAKSECDLLHLTVQHVKGQRLVVPMDVAGARTQKRERPQRHTQLLKAAGREARYAPVHAEQNSKRRGLGLHPRITARP